MGVEASWGWCKVHRQQVLLGLRRSELGDQGWWVKSGMLEIEVMAAVVMGDRSRVCTFVTSMDFSED